MNALQADEKNKEVSKKIGIEMVGICNGSSGHRHKRNRLGEGNIMNDINRPRTYDPKNIKTMLIRHLGA